MREVFDIRSETVFYQTIVSLIGGGKLGADIHPPPFSVKSLFSLLVGNSEGQGWKGMGWKGGGGGGGKRAREEGVGGGGGNTSAVLIQASTPTRVDIECKGE